MLAKVLLSAAFKDEGKGTDADQIDVDTLKCFSLLHSQGEPLEKATALYNILQDGGLAAHEMITATDKDFRPCFMRLCKLASKDIFKLAHSLGEEIEDLYDDECCDTLLSSDNMDIMIEDIFLEHVYGASSRLTNEVWLEKVTHEDGQWIYTVEQLRDLILKSAGVDKRH